MTQPSVEPDGAVGAAAGGTGSADVDRAVVRLAELAGRPVAEHVAVLEDVHRALAATLSSARAEPGPTHPGR